MLANVIMLSIRLAVNIFIVNIVNPYLIYSIYWNIKYRFTLYKLNTRISCTYLETYSNTLDSFYPVCNDQDHYPTLQNQHALLSIYVASVQSRSYASWCRDFVYLVFCEGSGALARPSFHAEDMKLLCMHGYSSRAILPERLRQILSLIVHEIFHAHTSVYL